MESSGGAPHSDRAVDVALAEFNALRAEVLSHITAQAAVIGLGLTALGVILGVTKGGANEELLLAVPPVTLLVVLLHVVRSYRMETIGRHIRTKLWPYLQTQAGTDLPSWEGEVANPKLSFGKVAQALFVELPPLQPLRLQNPQSRMSAGDLLVVVVLSDHRQAVLDSGGGYQRIGETNGAMSAGGATVRN